MKTYYPTIRTTALTAILVFLNVFTVNSQSTDRNFVKTEELFTPVNNENSIDTIQNNSNRKRTTIAYFDGLGRPDQSIIVSKSPSYKDIVQHIEYDGLGRQVKSFLPFTISNSNGAFVTDADLKQITFYAEGTNPDIPETAYPYNETRFEQSPLNRVQEAASPGDLWAMGTAHTVSLSYSTNTSSEVKLWQVSSGSITSPENYAAGKLYKNTTTDEDGKPVTTFTTLDGLQILIRRFVNGSNADTYYVYNDLNLLVCVIMPNATIDGNTFTDYKNAYRYTYDERKRMTEKYLPGAERIDYVYNKADQLVFEQDGNRRIANEWKFYKYDVLGRIILEGSYNRVITRANLQNELNQSEARLFEIKDNRADSYYQGYFGYSNDALPDGHGTTINVKVVYFYDNYDFDADGDSDETFAAYYNSTNAGFSDQAVKLPQGQLTGKMFGYYTYDELYFYDERNRMVQTVNGRSNTGNQYNFNGTISKTNRKFSVSQTSILYYTFVYGYDHDWRPTNTTISINNGTPQLLNTMKYTELSALKTKFLHGNATSFLQKQQYAYNIRGWLTQINNIDGTGTDVFAEKLFYESLPSYYNSHATARFNGNISGMEWYTKDMVSTGTVNGYALNYDDINRLTGSGFFNRNGSTVSWQDSQQPSNLNYGTMTGIGSENSITYDNNGNIKTLVRKGKRSTEVVVFDSFTYEYDGNKLLRVRDAISGQNSLGDFLNTASLTAVNNYDQNGNLIADVDRNMTIQYNRNNLPVNINFTGGHIVNAYRYDGTKLSKIVYDANERETLNEKYFGDLVLSNNVPARILHADGVIELSSTFQPTYYYHLKDHLGNVRAVVSPGSNNTTVINQTNEYYPFGMSYTKSVSSLLNPVVPNKFKYNGKEEQEMPGKWLDYGARFYDTQLGRWHSVDPLAELHHGISSFVYCANNPVNLVDPNGMDWNGPSTRGSSWEGGPDGDPFRINKNEIDELDRRNKDISEFLKRRNEDKFNRHFYNKERGIAGDGDKNKKKKSNGDTSVTIRGSMDADNTLDLIGTLATTLEFIKTEVDIAQQLGATSKVLPVISKYLGPASYVAIGAKTISDVRALQRDEMSVARFSYNSTGTAVGIGVTVYTGNPILGALAGGLFVAGQQVYDAANLVFDKTQEYLYNFENSVGKTWIPGQ